MASKSKSRRRVLRASCLLAALIVAGSSFAWFTSKDEVTNRLTATTDYGVSIVEDFYPPKDMTPGQKVNKDVSAVNTGNVDALVRVALEHEFDYSKLTSTNLGATIDKVAETYVNKSGETKTNTDASWTNAYTLGSQDAPDGYPDYLYTTYTFKYTKPETTAPNELVELDPREYVDSNGITHANEVTTLQAGGELVVAASKSVAPTSEFPVRSGDDTNGGTAIDIIYDLGSTSAYQDTSTNPAVTKNTQYTYYDSTGNKYYAVVKNDDGTYTKTTYELTTQPNSAAMKASTPIGVTKDYSGVNQYKAAAAGLYIFRRSADITGTGTGATDNESPTYSGYYFQDNKFYALETLTTNGVKTVNLKSSDGTQTNVVTTDDKGIVNGVNVKYLVKEKGITQDDAAVNITQTLGTLTYTEATGTTSFAADANGNTLQVKFTKGDKDVIVYIELDSDWRTNWTYVDGNTSATNDYGYFYYNKPLAAGETSAKLVDDVILDSTMTSENFLDLTYDLNVLLDSIQITKDEYNNEVATQADGWASAEAHNNTNGKTPTTIETITWS